jgi:hypothetical protein
VDFVETFACGSAAAGFPGTGLLVGTFVDVSLIEEKGAYSSFGSKIGSCFGGHTVT